MAAQKCTSASVLRVLSNGFIRQPQAHGVAPPAAAIAGARRKRSARRVSAWVGAGRHVVGRQHGHHSLTENREHSDTCHQADATVSAEASESNAL
jgi:hypothetical protein